MKLAQAIQDTLPRRLRDSPLHFRFYKWTVAGTLAIWIIASCIAGYLHQALASQERKKQMVLVNRAARVAADRILSPIEHFLALATGLATSPQFVRPQDLRLDQVAFDTITHGAARRLAFYEGIDAWLPSETGSGEPLNTLPDAPYLWQVAHGLPWRSPRGSLLARSRRQLAAQIMTGNPEIIHIAELDSVGRVVFLVPYAYQLRLNTFTVGHSILVPGSDSPSMSSKLISHPALVSGLDSYHVSILVPIRRTAGIGYLLLTIPQGLRSHTLNSESFGVLDSSKQLLLFAGNEETAKRPNKNLETVYDMRIPGSEGSYFLAYGRPVEASSTPVVISTILVSLMFLACGGLCLWFFRMLLLWVLRLQWGLDHSQERVQKRVQTLAHDFQNQIFVLKAVTASVTDIFSKEQLQRFDGAVTDLSVYTAQLSNDVVRDAFSQGDFGGRAPTAPVQVPTYLRGTLETIVQRQSAAFGHEIPVTFAPEFIVQEPFVHIGVAALTRILSNLLWNATEACMQAGTHDIKVLVYRSGDVAIVEVVDNGCGIAPEHQARIFEPEFSTKGDARGKGLAGCISLASQSGGSVVLARSTLGAGSALQLRLALRETPNFFVNSITLNGDSVLVVVDDEDTAFEYWKKAVSDRLRDITLPSDRTPRLIKLSKPSELRENRFSARELGTLFLIDYEFRNEDTNGIELIEELGLAQKAILVTNFPENTFVVNAVERLNIRLLSKTYLLNARFPLDIGGPFE